MVRWSGLKWSITVVGDGWFCDVRLGRIVSCLARISWVSGYDDDDDCFGGGGDRQWTSFEV